MLHTRLRKFRQEHLLLFTLLRVKRQAQKTKALHPGIDPRIETSLTTLPVYTDERPLAGPVLAADQR